MEIKIRNIWKDRRGFTLVEILTVIVILGVLMGLSLGVTKGVMESMRRSRATGEINVYATGLSRFEIDNGFLPPCISITVTGDKYDGDFKKSEYREAAATLFLALTGRQVFSIKSLDSVTKDSLGKSYVELKSNQVFTDGDSHSENAKSWIIDTYLNSGYITDTQGAIKDPWGNPYGYYYNNKPNNPGENSIHNTVGFDLWSTAGNRDNDTKTEDKWVSNWQN